MVSIKGFYKASVDVFGIFAIYGAMVLSIISTLYFLPILGTWILIRTFIPLSISITGIIGILYLIINVPNYSNLLSGSYTPTDKEKTIAIFFTAIYLITLLISLTPYL